MEGLRKVTRWTSYVGSNFDIVALMFLILEFVATVLIIKLVPCNEEVLILCLMLLSLYSI